MWNVFVKSFNPLQQICVTYSVNALVGQITQTIRAWGEKNSIFFQILTSWSVFDELSLIKWTYLSISNKENSTENSPSKREVNLTMIRV